MRILQISPRVPYPLTDGGKIGIYNIVKYLALRGHKITLVCFDDGKNKYPELEKYCKLIIIRKKIKTTYLGLFLNLFSSIPYGISKYYSPVAKKKIYDLQKKNKYDIVHLDHLHTAFYGVFIKNNFNLPVVLREHNIENMIMKRFYKNKKNIFVKFYAYLQYKKLYKYESNICEIFNQCLMITKNDEKIIKEMNPEIKTSVITAGVDTSYFHPIKIKEEEFSIISVASMDWLPNIEAIEWFCKEILPLVKNEIQAIKFYVVGINPPNSIKDLADNNVIVTGYLEDVREYIAKCQVFVVPLKTGSGIRIKILNSLAMGKAIVSTSIGCEGIDVTNGKDIYIADDKEEFAKKIIYLLKNKNERRKLGREGIKLIKEKYQWEKIAEQIETKYAEIIKEDTKCKH